MTADVRTAGNLLVHDALVAVLNEKEEQSYDGQVAELLRRYGHV